MVMCNGINVEKDYEQMKNTLKNDAVTFAIQTCVAIDRLVKEMSIDSV